MPVLPVGITILVYGGLGAGLLVRGAARWMHQMWLP